MKPDQVIVVDLELLRVVDVFQVPLQLLECWLYVVGVEIGAVYHLCDDKQNSGRDLEYFGHGCVVEADDWSGGAKHFLLSRRCTRMVDCFSSRSPMDICW